jgi:hypothetical protein
MILLSSALAGLTLVLNNSIGNKTAGYAWLGLGLAAAAWFDRERRRGKAEGAKWWPEFNDAGRRLQRLAFAIGFGWLGVFLVLDWLF